MKRSLLSCSARGSLRPWKSLRRDAIAVWRRVAWSCAADEIAPEDDASGGAQREKFTREARSAEMPKTPAKQAKKGHGTDCRRSRAVDPLAASKSLGLTRYQVPLSVARGAGPGERLLLLGALLAGLLLALLLCLLSHFKSPVVERTWSVVGDPAMTDTILDRYRLSEARVLVLEESQRSEDFFQSSARDVNRIHLQAARHDSAHEHYACVLCTTSVASTGRSDRLKWLVARAFKLFAALVLFNTYG